MISCVARDDECEKDDDYEMNKERKKENKKRRARHLDKQGDNRKAKEHDR